ncbi:LOW QUALITY PROTEIN: osteoclast-associated immunoglobulin-like receptor [Pangshura tecta]
MAAHRATNSAVDVVEFPIRNVSWRDAGSYSCRYRTKWDLPVWSEPSDPLELVVAGAPEPSPAPGLTHPIIAGVSAAAAGLLLLLLAFLCYRRKGPAPRQSRESEAAATVYAQIGEGKQLDVLRQEHNPGAERLAYVELDHQVLQGIGGPSPAPEPVLYAAIVSQGPHGQSPCGAGAPHTHRHSVNPGGVIGAAGGASATRG